MPNLSVNYMGLTLKSPIMVSSSGLTSNVNDIKELEKNGAGAVVLKSLFEEEIISEFQNRMQQMHQENYIYPETIGFYEDKNTEDTLTSYLKLIRDCKKEVSIPIIASINCVTSDNWPYFAKSLQDAGADALELNIFILKYDQDDDPNAPYLRIIEAVQKEVTIPISIKISPHFSNIIQSLKDLSKSGIKSMVLFNRYYSPDIDIENFSFTTSNKYSSPNDYTLPLRWVGILADKVMCQLSASTGIHNGETVVKMLLAGATTIQITSTLYKNGFAQLQLMTNYLKAWMSAKKFNTIDEFKGTLSQSKSVNAGAYMRLQFMKHFSEKEKV